MSEMSAHAVHGMAYHTQVVDAAHEISHSFEGIELHSLQHPVRGIDLVLPRQAR